MITRAILAITALCLATSPLHAKDVIFGGGGMFNLGGPNVKQNGQPPASIGGKFKVLPADPNAFKNGGSPPAKKPNDVWIDPKMLPGNGLQGRFDRPTIPNGLFKDQSPPGTVPKPQPPSGNQPPNWPPNGGKWFPPPRPNPSPWWGGNWRPRPRPNWGWSTPPVNRYPYPGNSLGSANAVPSNRIPSPAMYRVLVINPAENDGDVNFVVRRRSYQLPAGSEQEISVGARDTMKFDRGNGQAVRYRAEPGTYVFKVDDDGWDLYRTTIKVTIDNSDNEFPFRYLADGKSKRLSAGQTATLKAQYPLTIEYDPGNGGDVVAQTLRTGIYRVGLNDTEDGITLYDADAADGTLVAKVSHFD